MIEKANGDRERHRCPSELALKVEIPSEMEVAPRYIQLTLHTLVSPLTLLFHCQTSFRANRLSCLFNVAIMLAL